MAEGQGIFRTGLDYMRRPSDTSLNLVAELAKMMQGRSVDFGAAVGRGMSGGGGGGMAVMSALTNTPEEDLSTRQRIAATAMDFANPLDPSWYVGFGGLSKTGKAGQLLSKVPGIAEELRLAPTVAEQFARGQRGLVTFGGKALNPPGTALAAKGASAIGNKLLQSEPGRALMRSFGGRKAAAVYATGDEDIQRMTALVYDAVNDIAVPIRGYEQAMRPHMDHLERLLPEEGIKMGDIISEIARGEKSLQDGLLEFVNTGPKTRMDLRKKAWNAASELQKGMAEFAGALNRTGLDMYIGPEIGFLPRLIKPISGGNAIPAERIFGVHEKLGRNYKFEGQAANHMNRMLTPRSIMHVTPEYLDNAGKNAVRNWKYREMQPGGSYRDLTGVDAFNAEMIQKPGSMKAFMEKHRLTLEQLDTMLQNQDIAKVERNAVRLFKEMQRQVVEDVRTDQLILDLKNRGIAMPWSDDLHKADDLVNAKYFKIDKGRFEHEPLAIPKEWDDAFKRVMNVLAPSPDMTILGQHISKVLPNPIADFGVTSALKLNLIYGLIPSLGLKKVEGKTLPRIALGEGKHVKGVPISAPAYFSRNYWTGVINNYIEGLGPSPNVVGSVARMQRHYGEGTRLAMDWSRGIWDGGKNGSKTITLAGDVVVEKERLRQMFVGMNMHGGGTDPFAIGRELTSDAAFAQHIARLRKELYHNTTSLKIKGVNVSLSAAQDASEYAVRIPLMLHTLEETFLQAKKAGVQTPKYIRALSGRGEAALVENHRRLMESYRYAKDSGMQNINLRASMPGALGADAVLDELPGVTQAAFENAREAVLRAHFDYSDLSPLEQRIRNSWIPFYAWTRKNLPRHTVKMGTDFGKYVPFARAYYKAFVNQGVDPMDLPTWMSEMYALPIGEPDGRVRVIDMTNFLPFLEPVQYVAALTGEPAQSGNAGSELLRLVGSQMNPLLTTPAEIAMQTDLFTGRRFADTPNEFMGFGLPGGQSTRQVVDVIRGLGDLNRLNPGNIFTKIGELTGAITPEAEGRRPSMNEPAQGFRWLRAGTGLTVRETDKSRADLTPAQRRRERNKIRRQIIDAKGNGLLIKDLRKKLKELGG